MKTTEKEMKKVSNQVIEKIMDRGMQIDKDCHEHCRDFKIMVASERHPDILILRWTTIDIDDIDRPKQCYRYECFETDGTPQDCSIHYSDQNEANDFFSGLETLHTQQCAIDHKL